MVRQLVEFALPALLRLSPASNAPPLPATVTISTRIARADAALTGRTTHGEAPRPAPASPAEARGPARAPLRPWLSLW